MIGIIIMFIACFCIPFTYNAGGDCQDCGYALNLFFRHMIYVQMDMYVYSVWLALFFFLYMRWLAYHVVSISLKYLAYLWLLPLQGCCVQQIDTTRPFYYLLLLKSWKLFSGIKWEKPTLITFLHLILVILSLNKL